MGLGMRGRSLLLLVEGAVYVEMKMVGAVLVGGKNRDVGTVVVVRVWCSFASMLYGIEDIMVRAIYLPMLSSRELYD